MSSENVKPNAWRCPSCNRAMSALSTRMPGLRAGWLPTVGDDVSWGELRDDHADGCYWYETRGFRRFVHAAA